MISECELPSKPLQGSVTVTGTYFLDVATFSCDSGYDLVGSQELICENEGSWNGSNPTCSPRECILLAFKTESATIVEKDIFSSLSKVVRNPFRVFKHCEFMFIFMII